MAIVKQAFKTKPECKVKFTLSAEETGGAETAALVGAFNNWDETATPMKKQKGGGFSVTLTLPAGATSQFRYLLDGKRWINDAAADGYAHCSFSGEENSLLQL